MCIRDSSQKSGVKNTGTTESAAGLAATMGTSSGAGMGAMVVDQLKRRFMKKLLVRQGAGMLGRAVPFGIGAVIGGVGNRAMAKAVVQNARDLFGPLPAAIPGEIVQAAAAGEDVADGADKDGNVLSGLIKALPVGKKDEKKA